MELQVGEIVTLVSGSNPLTVLDVIRGRTDTTPLIVVCWWNPAEFTFMRTSFPESVLIRMPTDIEDLGIEPGSEL